MRTLYLLHLSILAGCTASPTDTDVPSIPPVTDDTDPPTPVTPIDTGDPGPNSPLPDCSTLALTPGGVVPVELGSQQFFQASGVIGDPVFQVDGAGTVTLDGLYTAPDVSGPEAIVLEDTGCVGSVRADITLVDALDVQPADATVPPSTSVPLVISGGSGSTECAFASNGSGGSLNGCVYMAGATSGTDLIDITDTVTNSRRQSVFTVVPGSGLSTRASEGWMVPIDGVFDPEIEGGSGSWTIQSGDPNVVDAVVGPNGEALLQGTGAGQTQLVIEDAFLPALTLTRTVHTLAPLQPPTHPSGVFTERGRVLERDLNGDGLNDVVLADRDASIAAERGGVVEVYLGTANGINLDAPPEQQLFGKNDVGLFGTDIALGDLDGDGIDDLVVTASNVNWIQNAVGEITVHLGLGNGRFDEDPYRVYNGQRASDRLGSSVVVCDVDGDGAQDLISAAQTLLPGTNLRVGALWMYRQDALGLPLTAEQRFTERFDGTDWLPVTNGRIGLEDLEIGDIDHDGLCDVVAEVTTQGFDDGENGPGFIVVYSGDMADGLTDHPTRVFRTTGDNGVRFGRSIAVGNVDATPSPSGLPDDLLVGAGSFDGEAGEPTRRGRALLFAGGPSAELIHTPDDAVWSLTGTNSNESVGQGVGIQDNGDLLIMGTGRQEVYRVPGGTDFVPEHTITDTLPADTIILTPVLDDTDTFNWTGATVDAIGDGAFFGGRLDRILDDGTVEAVDVSSHVHLRADTTSSVTFRDGSAGDLFGMSAARIDVTGDGVRNLVVGGPAYAEPEHGAVSGSMFARDGAGWTRFGTEGPTFSGGDRRGWDLATGDLDSDGRPDLYMAARSDSRPANPALDSACAAGARNNTGHVAVYLGRNTGLAARPDFMWWPSVSNDSIEEIAGGFDFDGDGFEDILVGMRRQKAAIVYGQAPPTAGETHELCRQDITTTTENGGFGESVAVIGDLDGDGCEEVAVGASIEDLGFSNQGIIRVIWGRGPACSTSAARYTILGRGIANERFGVSLAAGEDVTGDGLPDLLVGSTIRALGADRVGGAALVSSQHILSLPTVNGSIDTAPDSPVQPLMALNIPVVDSFEPSSGFGASVAFVDQRIAVGMPSMGSLAGGRSGGVAVYEVSDGMPSITPSWILAGESFSSVGQFGATIDTIDTDLIIGAPGSSANGTVHVGGTYVAPF